MCSKVGQRLLRQKSRCVLGGLGSREKISRAFIPYYQRTEGARINQSLAGFCMTGCSASSNSAHRSRLMSLFFWAFSIYLREMGTFKPCRRYKHGQNQSILAVSSGQTQHSALLRLAFHLREACQVGGVLTLIIKQMHRKQFKLQALWGPG